MARDPPWFAGSDGSAGRGGSAGTDDSAGPHGSAGADGSTQSDGADRGPKDSDPPGRGQTTIDFLIGILLFLVVVGFVFLFVPRLLAPFETGGELPLVANRVADQLVGYQLSDPTRETALNATCAGWFFNGSTPDPCPGFDNDRPLTERLGVPSDYRVNVTVEGNVTGDERPEVLCYDPPVVGDCSSGGTRLATGDPTPTDYDAVVEAPRTVSVGGRSARLVVRVW